MTIQFSQNVPNIGGVNYTAGQTATLNAQTEYRLVGLNLAAWVGSPPTVPDPNNRGVQFVATPSGGVAIAGPNGSQYSTLGSDALTVGNGGKYSTLADAFADRVALAPQTLIKTTTLTVSGTSSGTNPVFKFTLASGMSAPNPYSDAQTLYGLRIGGPTNPIIPCRMYSSTVGYLEYAFPADLSGVSAELFILNYSTIALLPGTVLTYTDSTAAVTMTVPAFTTICAMAPGTAELVRQNNGGSPIFTFDATANKIRFTGLRMTEQYRKINSIFITAPKTYSDSPFVPLADIQFDHCRLKIASQDFFYTVGAGAIGVAFLDNDIYGDYDVMRLGTHRMANIQRNHIYMKSDTVLGDGGAPAGVAWGSAGATTWAYPTQNHIFKDNYVRCYSEETVGGAGAYASSVGVSIRNGVSAQSVFQISNNTFDVETHCDIAMSAPYYTYSSLGLSVDADVGSAAASVLFTGNNVRAVKSGSQAASMSPAQIADSAVATCPIHTAGNSVFGGGATVMGRNTAPATLY